MDDNGYSGIFDFFNYSVYYDFFDYGRIITTIAIAAEIFFIIIFFKDRKKHRDLTNNMADTKLLKRKKNFQSNFDRCGIGSVYLSVYNFVSFYFRFYVQL